MGFIKYVPVFQRGANYVLYVRKASRQRCLKTMPYGMCRAYGLLFFSGFFYTRGHTEKSLIYSLTLSGRKKRTSLPSLHAWRMKAEDIPMTGASTLRIFG